MPSDESKGSQLDAIGSLAQRQLDNTRGRHDLLSLRRRILHYLYWFATHSPTNQRHAASAASESLGKSGPDLGIVSGAGGRA